MTYLPPKKTGVYYVTIMALTVTIPIDSFKGKMFVA